MKNARKLVAAAMALTMVSAVAPLSVFAAGEYTVSQDGVKLDGEETSNPPAMEATLDVQSTYTVTIPANVALSKEDSVSKNIEVSNVMLKKGQKIKVKLEEAEFINTGDSTFLAKTKDGDSTATYTIGKGTDKSGIKVGDVVATFDKEDTEAKTITFSEATGNTYAGAHTETLTFSISVENRKITKNVTILPSDFNGNSATKDGVTLTVGSFYNDPDNYCLFNGGTFTADKGEITHISFAAYEVDTTGEGWSGYMADGRAWSGAASTVSYGGSIYQFDSISVALSVEE